MSLWDSFWVVVLWLLWATIFVAYLMALFSVLLDIIRDDSLKGGVKAMWIILLILLPVITALVYLIVRGDGMSKRSTEAIRQQQLASEAYVRSVAGATDPATQIAKGAELLAAGAISQAEYDQLKAKALAG